MSINLTINGKQHQVTVEPETPLLWVLRDTLGLTGTKYGCGISTCGACTVLIDGKPRRSCRLPVSRLNGSEVTTIEGISQNGLNVVQQAWIEEDVVQCGYCQSGQVMSATALLAENPNPSDADIDKAMRGNICRCGVYQRIKKAIHRAAEMAQEGE